MARVEEMSSEEEEEPEVIVEDETAELEHDDDSDASDDISEEDSERELEKKVQELEAKILKNPYIYDDHLQLIEALDKLSELERLREAFERLHRLSGLTAELWLMRLQTESSLAHSPDERAAVHALFNQATTENYSIPLYVDWCSFSVSGESADEVRSAVCAILKRTGSDPLNGKLFWDTLKEYEKEQLKLLSSESATYGEQVMRVAQCLCEQLCRPLLNTSAAKEELQALAATDGRHFSEGFLDMVEKQHEAASKILEKISKYEDQLLIAENAVEKFEIFKDYIERVRELIAQKHDDKNDICDDNLDELPGVLYDRATYECMSSALVESLLDAYLEFSRGQSADEYARVLDVCVSRRPQLAKYWVKKMQRLEKEEKDFNEIKSVLEKALAVGLDNREQYEILWMSYLECLRRCTVDSSLPPPQPEAIEILRQNFRLAWDSLGQMWGEEADTNCTILMFWARLEYQQFNDHKRGKEIIEEILQYGYNKTLSRFWLPFLELEGGRNPRPSEQKLRDLHRRAVKFTQDYPPAVCERWIDFERDYGTIKTLIKCQETCQEKLKEWQKNYESLKEKKFANQKQARNKSKAQDKFKNEAGKSDGQEVKGKKRSAEGIEVNPAKKKREGGDRGKSEGDGKTNGNLKRSHIGDDEEAQSKRQRRTSDSAKPLNGETNSSELPTEEKEACTLFVSNLDFKFSEEALRTKLSEYGEVRSLRVVRGVKAFGGSICYCEYATPESVDSAIKHDRTPLDGRPMFLSRYRADKSKPRFRYATQPERNKLFVKNLPFSFCTDAQLREVFAPHGALVDIRIVTYKDGRPKGLAYVEYADEKSAAAALQKTDNQLLGDRNIQVALSAPPPRADHSLNPLPSLGQGKRDSGGTRRTQLSSFVPRVLQKPVAAASTSKPAPSTSIDQQSKPMSNSDFRNMLLNNK